VYRYKSVRTTVDYACASIKLYNTRDIIIIYTLQTIVEHTILYYIVHNGSDHRTLKKPTHIRLYECPCKVFWNALRWPKFSGAMRARDFPTYLTARSSHFTNPLAKVFRLIYDGGLCIILSALLWLLFIMYIGIVTRRVKQEQSCSSNYRRIEIKTGKENLTTRILFTFILYHIIIL